MSPEQLMKYAEHGARTRLVEIHTELNELAQSFPEVVSAFTSRVKFAPKALEKVTPKYVAKPNGKPNGAAHAPKRQSTLSRLVTLERYLSAHPGASTQDLAQALGVTSNRALILLPLVAKSKRDGGGRSPMTWTLKPKKAS